jgi:hypothetical protein
MAGLDDASLKKGEKLGGLLGSPVAFYQRAADNAPPWPVPLPVLATPFYVLPVDGKTKEVSVVVGTASTAAPAVALTISYVRAGVPTVLKTAAMGAWGAGLVVSLGPAAVTLLAGDVLIIEITNPAGLLLPSLLVLVSLDLS